MIWEMISFSTQINNKPSFMTSLGILKFVQKSSIEIFYCEAFFMSKFGSEFFSKLLFLVDWLALEPTWAFSCLSIGLEQSHGGLIKIAWTSLAYWLKSYSYTLFPLVNTWFLAKFYLLNSLAMPMSSCCSTSVFHLIIISNTLTPSGTFLSFSLSDPAF